MKDLIERLRIVGGVGDDAADFIEQQAAEIERLTATVKILQALHDEDTLTHIALQAKLSAMEAVEPVANVEPTKLDEIEQYRLQMAGISTAALGYWREGNDIHPDYDTVALRDVAKLYAKYDLLYKAAPKVAQPLTDEQIANLHRDAYTTGKAFTTIEVYHYFARAIEAAHGIGGQQP